MKKLLKYFNPHEKVGLYERQKGNAFVIINLISLGLLMIITLYFFFSATKNWAVSIISSLSIILFTIASLFLVRRFGIRFAGNFYTVFLTIILAISVNFLDVNISVLYKFLQGFYSLIGILVLGVLFSSKIVLLINAGITMLSAFRVYFFSTKNFPELKHLSDTWFIQYIIILTVLTVIIFFAVKFAENAIKTANKDARIKAQQNQELIASEEEIRASNEELRSTTDALRESYDALQLAKDKADESNRLKTLFLSNISHEVRTPMNGIIGFSKLLTTEGVDNESKEKFTNVVIKSSEQLLKVIEDIIEVSVLETKRNRVEITPVNLNQFLNDLMDVFTHKKVNENIDLKLELSLSDGNSNILTDESRLSKILSNLIENAIKFTEKGFVKVACQDKNGKIEFVVKDTGIGIDRENTYDIFERFVQADETVSKDFGGLGLGLTIARENVEMLGGELKVESEMNMGATFSFEIDYKPINEEEYEVKTLQQDDVLSKAHKKQYQLLVAEDEEMNFYYLSEILKLLNYKIDLHHARNGKEAIEMSEKLKVDLVLMDIKMPVLNGLEATKAIKKNKPGLKVVAQTAYSTEEEKEKTLAAGCDDFITKPISYETLKETLDKYLN